MARKCSIYPRPFEGEGRVRGAPRRDNSQGGLHESAPSGVYNGVQLPDPERLRVDREKVVAYLLSRIHPHGRGKADFFVRFGFRVEDWELLTEALRKHGASQQVVKTVESPYGRRYAVEGPPESPDGRNPLVRTVWLVKKSQLAARLITAHPIKERDD
jgi:hypothetical protein